MTRDLHNTLLPQNRLVPAQAFENPWDEKSLTQAAALCFLAGAATMGIAQLSPGITDSKIPYSLVIPVTCFLALCSYSRCLCTRDRLTDHIEAIEKAPVSNRNMLRTALAQKIQDNPCMYGDMNRGAHDIAKGSPGKEWFIEFGLLGTTITSAISTGNLWLISAIVVVAALAALSLKKPATAGLALRERFLRSMNETTEETPSTVINSV